MTDMPVRQRVSTLSVNVKTLFIIQCHTPVTIIKTTYLLTYCHHLFQVEEVYSMTGNTIIPDYIKSIASPLRNRHYDNLIEMPSEVRSIY